MFTLLTSPKSNVPETINMHQKAAMPSCVMETRREGYVRSQRIVAYSIEGFSSMNACGTGNSGKMQRPQN
jgi:hypothetical protein